MAKTDKNTTSAGGGLKAKLMGMTDTNLLLTITIAVFFLLYIGAMAFLGSGFLKPQTFFNILNANAALIILACGMSLVMITGGIDISVGGVTALVSMCCAVYLDYKGGNVFMAVIIALAIGLAFGAFQGFLVAYLDIQPFIVTLAGMFFARGMTTIVNTSPFNVENEAFVALKMTRVNVPGLGSVNKIGKYVPAYVEIGVLVALLVVIVMFVLYQRKENQVPLPFNLRPSGGYRRFCVLPARGFRLSLPCDGGGDGRDCFLHHWRHHADGRCR